MFDPRNKVQELASSSLAYAKHRGARDVRQPDDLVEKMSGIATHGRHLQNAERDLHFAIRAWAKNVGANILEVPVQMWDPSENAIVDCNLSVLDPVSLMSCLWHRGREVFRKVCFGSMTENDVKAYWKNASERCAWFQVTENCKNPAKWDRLIPLSLYGDDVNTYRNTEAGAISIIAFCSDFAFGNSPMLRYMLLTLYSVYMSCQHTYNDILRKVFDRLRLLCDETAGHPWQKEGYSFCLSAVLGDMKWQNDQYGIHNFRANTPCSLCRACKVAADVRDTIADFRDGANHLQTAISHEEYVQQLPQADLPIPMQFGVRHTVGLYKDGRACTVLHDLHP